MNTPSQLLLWIEVAGCYRCQGDVLWKAELRSEAWPAIYSPTGMCINGDVFFAHALKYETELPVPAREGNR